MKYIFLPIPMMIAWVLLTGQLSLEGLIIGYTLALLLVIRLAQEGERNLNPATLPVQLFTAVIYIIVLTRDIVLSGVDVVLRIVGIRPLRPGIIAVPIQLKENDDQIKEVIGALSAHSITITPGELVVDYSEDRTVMYVHALDVEKSAPKVDADQTRRMEKFRRIIGSD